MDKNKLIPLVVLAILVCIIGVLLYVNKKNSASFDSLVINYNNDQTTHSDLKLDDVVVVNNISFWIVSKTKNELVLHSSEDVIIDNENTSEVILKTNKNYEICFTNNTCSLFVLE